MSELQGLRYRPIPLRALVTSFGALAVPVLSSVAFSEAAAEYEVLLWLLPLVPALLLSYYRGWRGAAVAIAIGMVALVAIQLALLLLGRTVEDWSLLLGVVGADIAIAFGIGIVTELLLRERVRAERLALLDELTGIPNRRYARIFLETEFAAAQRGRPVAVVLFDLDRFKAYNDSRGHAQGDEVLRRFARILDQTTRRTSLSARFGGDEFIAILPACDAAGALTFASRVAEQLRAAQAGPEAITVSAGIAVYDPWLHSPDTLIAAADQALYQAKADGWNHVRVYGRVPASPFAGPAS